MASYPRVHEVLDKMADFSDRIRSGDWTGHIGMFTDSPALQNVMNELGPQTPNFQATCTGYGVPV